MGEEGREEGREGGRVGKIFGVGVERGRMYGKNKDIQGGG